MRLGIRSGVFIACLLVTALCVPVAAADEVAVSSGLVVEVIGPAGANIGEYAAYELVVSNDTKDSLTAVKVWSDKLGYSDTVDVLPAGESRSFFARFGPISEADMPGPLTVDAQAECAEGMVAESWWVVDIAADYGTEYSADGSTRADVSVVIWGGWEGIPIRFWVEDQELETHYTAVNAAGEPQAMWTIYPPAGEHYAVRVEPQFADDLDPAAWDYRLTELEGGSAGYGTNGHDYAGCLIPSSSQTTFYFQLEASSTGGTVAVPTVAPAAAAAETVQPVPASSDSDSSAELPHTGVLDDVNVASLLNRLLILGAIAGLALTAVKKS